ncbi:hypothetical protein [Natronorubrum sp. DTA28]|uniref:hypothetical protein n=1 Tax=Natronorubrum sp. DTA28 TaxID=3447019 RepID=UPI003F859803
MLSTEVFVVGAVALVGLAILGVGLYIASIGAGRIRTARALRETGPTALCDVAGETGLVAFEGTVREGDDETLEAPVTGMPCLAYTVQARSRAAETGRSDSDDADGGAGAATDANAETGTTPDADTGAVETTETADNVTDDDRWSFDGGASASVPFAVEDGTDRIAVDPTNAVLSLEDWATETAWTDGSGLERDALDRLRAVGLSDADDGTDERGFARRQYRELRLEAGDDVHVFGGTVVDSSRNERASDRSITVSGGDWFEISAGGQQTVLSDNRRSGSLYLIFGGLIAVPGVGFTLAGIVGLVTTLVL